MKNKNNVNISLIFLLYFLSTIVIFYSFKSYYYLIILLPILINLILLKVNKKTWLLWILTIFISFIFRLLTYKIGGNIHDLNIFLLNNDFYTKKQELLNQIDNIYKNEYVNEFIKLLMFNEKNYNSDFYKSICSLGITYLFVVSGLHINLILFPIRKLFKNKPYPYYIFSVLFCFFYIYLLNYSISILRILFSNLILLIFKKKLNNFISTIISGWILLLIFSKEIYSASYIMSYLCTLLIIWLTTKIKNKFLLFFLINVLCFLLTIPIILNFNKRINIFIFFYNILFTNIISFIYIYLLIFAFIPPFAEINSKIILFIQNLIEITNVTSIFIEIPRTFTWSNSIYFSTLLGIFVFFNKKN